LINFFNILKNYFFFDILSDLIGLDLLKENNIRFKLNYILTNVQYNIYIGVTVNTTYINSFNAEINSISNVWLNANWLERENWDMFGIVFLNHNDLRRIFTDYGFNGFPLRKDFPLCGYVELRYDDEYKMLLYEPVEFSQEYRVFNFINPWDIYLNVKS
jgi:NADH-quinone oxidoreductase subunit C